MGRDTCAETSSGAWKSQGHILPFFSVFLKGTLSKALSSLTLTLPTCKTERASQAARGCGKTPGSAASPHFSDDKMARGPCQQVEVTGSFQEGAGERAFFFYSQNLDSPPWALET